MKFRPVRELLSDSMNEVVEVDGLAGLKEHLGKLHAKGDITSEHQGIDSRIGWDSYIVMVNGRPAGYTDGDAAAIIKEEA